MDNTFDLLNCLTVKRKNAIIIWIFNIGVERFWNDQEFTVKDVKENIVVNRIEEINLLLTRKQDILILRDKPDKRYLEDLEKIGFDIPHILCPEIKDDEKSISELVINDERLLSKLRELSSCTENLYFVPYGVSDIEEKIAKECNLTIIGAASELNKKINNKVFSRVLSEKLGLQTSEGSVCDNIEEIQMAYSKLKTKFNKVIIKQPYGASGKGLYIVENERKFNIILRILNRFQSRYKKSQWLIEGWYDKKRDINYQIYVDSDGNVTTFSVKEQIIDKTVYIGSVIPPRISEDVYNKYIEYGEVIGKALYKKGFSGILGIDSIIIEDGSIIPIIEINARFTLSTYLSFLTYKFINRKIYSFYKRMHLKTTMNYEKLCKLLIESNIAYDDTNKCGVLCYIASTLKIDNSRNARLFFLVIGYNYEQLKKYEKILLAVLDNLNALC